MPAPASPNILFKAIGLDISDPQYRITRVPSYANFKLGYVYTFFYENWQHDMAPLSLVYKFEPNYFCYQAVNFHYIHPDAVARLMAFWTSNRRMFNPETGQFNIDYQSAVKRSFKQPSIFLRRYKINKIKFAYTMPFTTFQQALHVGKGSFDYKTQQILWSRSLQEIRVPSR